MHSVESHRVALTGIWLYVSLFALDDENQTHCYWPNEQSTLLIVHSF